MYTDTVLLKLRRDYSKDEVVMFALNKIQELQVENGKLISYVAELEDGCEGIKDKLLKQEQERNANLVKEVSRLRVYIKNGESLRKNENKQHVIRTLEEKIKTVDRVNRSYREKNIDLNSKLNILLTNPQHFTSKTLEEKVEFLKNMEV